MKAEIKYDPKTGKMMFQGVESIILQKSIMADIQKEFEKIIGPAYKTIIYKATKESVKRFFSGYFKIIFKTIGKLAGKRSIWEKIIETMPKVGWGYVEIKEFDEKNFKIILTLKNSCIATNYKKSKTSVCHIIAGMGAGLSTMIFNKDMNCKETKCIAKGDAYCEFKISPEESYELKR